MDYPNTHDFERAQSYRVSDARTILDRIGALLPGCTALRTDRYLAGPVNAANYLRFVFERKNEHHNISLTPDLGVRGGGKLASAYGLTHDVLDDLIADGLQLANLNPMGSWCLSPSDCTPRVVTPVSVDDRPIPEGSYLADTCEILGEELPFVGRIQVDYQITHGPGKSQRRRAYLRFLSGDGQTEFAAIDTAGMPLHFRQQILQMDSNRSLLALNLWRMGFWARQLGASADALAETFPILGYLTSALHITRMDLYREA